MTKRTRTICGLVWEELKETDLKCGSRWLLYRQDYGGNYSFAGSENWCALRYISGVRFEVRSRAQRSAVAKLLRLEKRVLKALIKEAVK